jgi:uncharacterized protein (TIGR02391 family)
MSKRGSTSERNEYLWEILHPEIAAVAKSRFETQHYADSVEAAFKHFNRSVKVRSGQTDRDGADLMNYVFSTHRPVLALDDLSCESGRSAQKGYMQMFSGGMTAIRNPKAHDNIDIDMRRAIHLLFVASLFMYKLEESHTLAASEEGGPV